MDWLLNNLRLLLDNRCDLLNWLLNILRLLLDNLGLLLLLDLDVLGWRGLWLLGDLRLHNLLFRDYLGLYVLLSHLLLSLDVHRPLLENLNSLSK